jgi:hypothetical protein
MIEVKVPKEIKDYQEKIIMGLSGKQLLTLGVAIILSAILFFSLRKAVPSKVLANIILVVSMPITATGWVKIENRSLVDYLKLVYRSFVEPTNRLYRIESWYLVETPEPEKTKGRKHHV